MRSTYLLRREMMFCIIADITVKDGLATDADAIFKNMLARVKRKDQQGWRKGSPFRMLKDETIGNDRIFDLALGATW